VTKVILKFANGATDSFEHTDPTVPVSFYIRAVTTEYDTSGKRCECICVFWFLIADELPDGTVLYQECTEKEAHRAWRGE
jgi:hypothetical protein